MVAFSGYKLIAVGSLVVADATACRFMRYTAKVTWEQANQTCTDNGMQLATIPDYEFDFYDTRCFDGSARARGNMYWVGARAGTTKHNDKVQLEWTNGTKDDVCSLSNKNSSGHTCKNIMSGQCVYIQGTERRNMRGSDCGSHLGFVCETLPAAGK